MVKPQTILADFNRDIGFPGDLINDKEGNVYRLLRNSKKELSILFGEIATTVSGRVIVKLNTVKLKRKSWYRGGDMGYNVLYNDKTLYI